MTDDSYEGALNTTLIGLGIESKPVTAFLYSQTAVAIVLAHSSAAFAILPIYVSLERIDRTYLQSAADLGDSPARAFWHATFPCNPPGIFACLMMAFAISFEEFFMAFFLEATQSSLPIYIWEQLRFPQDFPSLLALSTLILTFSFVVIFTSLRLAKIGQIALQDGAP